jgi:hypothetical protein
MLILDPEDINKKNYNFFYQKYKLHFFDKDKINLNDKAQNIFYSDILIEPAIKLELYKDINFYHHYREKKTNDFIDYYKNNYFEQYENYRNLCNGYLNYWSDNYKNIVEHGSVLIFGGNKILHTTFVEIFQYSKLNIYYTEYLFTGDRFYFEKRISSLYNRSNILNKFTNIKNNNNSKNLLINPNLFKIIKDVRVNNLNVKNKKRPIYYNILDTDNQNKVFILAQVIDDNSLVNTDLNYTHLNIYKKICDHFYKKGYEVYFKYHPWELKKHKQLITLKFLKKIYPQTYSRISKILFREEIDNYLNKNSYIISISSQYSLYYAVLYSYKIFSYKSFYSSESYSFEINDTNCDSITDNNNLLDYQEYKSLLQYLNFFMYESPEIIKTNMLVKSFNLKPKKIFFQKLNKLKNKPFLFVKDMFKNLIFKNR